MMANYKIELIRKKQKIMAELVKIEADLESDPTIELYKKYNLKLIDYQTVKSRISNLGKQVDLGVEVKLNSIN